MKQPLPPLTEHRLSRFITWGRLLLVWLGGVLFSDDRTPITRRHLRGRLFWADLDNVARYISCLVLLRACLDIDGGKGAPPHSHPLDPPRRARRLAAQTDAPPRPAHAFRADRQCAEQSRRTRRAP